jgi:hypothetical protein
LMEGEQRARQNILSDERAARVLCLCDELCHQAQLVEWCVFLRSNSRRVDLWPLSWTADRLPGGVERPLSSCASHTAISPSISPVRTAGGAEASVVVRSVLSEAPVPLVAMTPRSGSMSPDHQDLESTPILQLSDVSSVVSSVYRRRPSSPPPRLGDAVVVPTSVSKATALRGEVLQSMVIKESQLRHRIAEEELSVRSVCFDPYSSKLLILFRSAKISREISRLRESHRPEGLRLKSPSPPSLSDD